MKQLVPILLLLTVVAVIVLPGPADASSNCSSTSCFVAVDRTVQTNIWGVTTVSDRVVLNSTLPASHLTVGVPAGVSNRLRTASAVDSGSNVLAVSNLGLQTSHNYTALDVIFPSAKSGQYTFNVTMIYSDLLVYSPSGNTFAFSTSLFPVTDGSFNITSAHVRVGTGDWPTPKVSPPANTTVTGGFYDATGRPSELNYYNTTIWTISFSASGTSQQAFDVSASRLITISPSGSVQVTDNYTIANRGAIAASIPFILPKGITGVSASDFRPLVTPTPTVNPDGTETLTFTPRFSSIPFNQSVRVLITYQLSASTYVSSGSVGSFRLNFAAFNNVKFYEPILTTRIVTPMGFRLNTLTGQTPQVSGNQIVLQISPLTPSSSLGFSMTYQLSPFWASLGPLSWVGLVEAALAASVLALWRGQGAEAMVGGVPTQLIGQFVDLYDERSSLRMEEDKMEEDMGRGALNRYDYKQRRRMMDRRVNEIDRALAPVKQQLSGSQGRYADMVKRLERAEAELQVIKTTASDLKNQNRTGKISRDLYESLSNDLVRRKGKAEQTIDTVIINLREEIR